jgi:hypothetical protein
MSRSPLKDRDHLWWDFLDTFCFPLSYILNEQMYFFSLLTMYGLPRGSMVMEVWLIRSLRCGIRSTYSADAPMFPVCVLQGPSSQRHRRRRRIAYRRD